MAAVETARSPERTGTGEAMASRRTATHATWRPSARAITGAVAIAALVGLAMPGVALAAGKLEIFPNPPMLVTLIVLFTVLIFPVNSLIFKPIFRALDERASRITGARHRAEQIDEEADTVLARYEESIREARANAESSRKEMISAARTEQAGIAASARSDAEALVDRARRDISAALEDARGGLRASAEELGRAAAERILGRGL